MPWLEEYVSCISLCFLSILALRVDGESGFFGNTSDVPCNVALSSPGRGTARNGRPTINVQGDMYIHGAAISGRFCKAVNVDNMGVSPSVNVESTSPFTAVVIQARRESQLNPVGTFIETPRTTIHSCVYNNDTLTYSNNAGVRSLTLTWRAPDTEYHVIVFVATVYQSEDIYWSNVTSQQIRKGFRPIDVASCGKEKGCFRYTVSGQSCTLDDCDYVVTYAVHNELARFEISAKAEWAAIGFSSDRLMGGDDVLMCYRKAVSQPIAERAVIKYSHQPPTAPEDPGLSEAEAGYVDGRIVCRLARPLKIHSNDPYTVDLNGEWHQLYAWGSISRTGTRLRHTLATPPSSSRRIYLGHRHDVISGTSSLVVRGASLEVISFSVLFSAFFLLCDSNSR